MRALEAGGRIVNDPAWSAASWRPRPFGSLWKPADALGAGLVPGLLPAPRADPRARRG